MMDTAPRQIALELRGYCVEALSRHGEPRPIIRDLTFSLESGHTLAVVGESGAGKSLTMSSMLGLCGAGIRVSGSARLFGTELVGDPAAVRRASGHDALLMVQQAMSAFDPLVRMGTQLAETVLARDCRCSKESARERVRAILASLSFSDPEAVMNRFACELSGGMLQRCLVAAAILAQPRLIIADEPTSALDVLSRNRVVEVLRRMRERTGATLVIITHDLTVAMALADRVAVMKSGRLQAFGDISLLNHPEDDYTRYLVARRDSMNAALVRALSAQEAEHE